MLSGVQASTMKPLMWRAVLVALSGCVGGLQQPWRLPCLFERRWSCARLAD